MVAKSRSLSSLSLSTLLSQPVFSYSSSLLSTGLSEKKAISEADTKPEQNNKNALTQSAMILPEVIGLNVICVKISMKLST